jgi:hypothetical protein
MAYIRFPHEILYDILIWNYKKMKKQNKVYNLALKK